jgi:hypothetical protein
VGQKVHPPVTKGEQKNENNRNLQQ